MDWIGRGAAGFDGHWYSYAPRYRKAAIISFSIELWLILVAVSRTVRGTYTYVLKYGSPVWPVANTRYNSNPHVSLV